MFLLSHTRWCSGYFWMLLLAVHSKIARSFGGPHRTLEDQTDVYRSAIALAPIFLIFWNFLNFNIIIFIPHFCFIYFFSGGVESHIQRCSKLTLNSALRNYVLLRALFVVLRIKPKLLVNFVVDVGCYFGITVMILCSGGARDQTCISYMKSKSSTFWAPALSLVCCLSFNRK